MYYVIGSRRFRVKSTQITVLQMESRVRIPPARLAVWWFSGQERRLQISYKYEGVTTSRDLNSFTMANLPSVQRSRVVVRVHPWRR